MFIGHYGPAFAGKAADKALPLWLLFIAVQFMDVVWSLLVFLGIEKLRIVPGFTAMNPLDLYFMPFTHGLPGALLLAVLFGALCEIFLPQKGRTFLIIGLCVFSHWLLDLIVHVPDLPLIGDRMKVGFGLWRWRDISLAAEFIAVFGGLWFYLRRAPRAEGWGNFRLWALIFWLGAGELFATFGPQPASPQIAAAMALGGYGVFALFAWQVDRGWALARRKVPGSTLNL